MLNVLSVSFSLKEHRLQKGTQKEKKNPGSMHSLCTAATHYKTFTEAQLQQTEQLMTDLGASDICVFLVQP